MDITDITIDRECATKLRSCVRALYDLFVGVREASKKEKSTAKIVGLDPQSILALSSSFTFLVSRNKDICCDDGMLDAGCKVGLVLCDALKYSQLPNIDVIEIRFPALFIFGALIFTLFLVEIERGSIVPEEGEGIPIEKLKELLQGIPTRLVDFVRALPMKNIAGAKLIDDDSSSGHT